MNGIELHVVAPDAGSIRWVEISRIGFWLRHRQALDAGKDRPEGLEDQLHGFERLGNELAILEYDLTQCINEFLLSCELLYHEPDDLALKKFSVVYHCDNFYVRVQKLIDNVYGLLLLVVGVDPRRKVGIKETKEQVIRGLPRWRLALIAEALRGFERDEDIKQAVEARNLFVHHYREEPKWTMLHPGKRLHEVMAGDSVAEQVRRLSESGDLDRYAARKTDELGRTLTVIRHFRDRLDQMFADELSKAMSALAPATRQRLPPFVDGITGLGPQSAKLASMIKAILEAPETVEDDTSID